MITRGKLGKTFQNPKYANLHESTSIPLEPQSIKSALRHPSWAAAMQEKYDSLAQNNTWRLVPREPHMSVVGCKWVFKTKLKSDGSLERLKARLVAKGFTQVEGVDFAETFSPIIKPGTIRTALTVATVKEWHIRQMDVKNAFLHGVLQEPVFMEQPPGFKDSLRPNHVCYLTKALYGLKQAPRAWFDRLSKFLSGLGFFISYADPRHTSSSSLC